MKVQYKPVHKYQQQVRAAAIVGGASHLRHALAIQTGVLTKTTMAVNEQRVIVKNTKQDEPVVLTFVEHVPKSTDEKIKASLRTLQRAEHDCRPL